MKTNLHFLISVIQVILMTIGFNASSQNKALMVAGDENWDESFGASGMNVNVNCFIKKDGILYAGGEFTKAGGNKTLLKYGDLTGTNEVTEALPFEIFPNPAKDKFTIQCVKFKAENATLEICDLHGKKLLEKQIPAGTEEIEIDVSHLKNGVYFCRLTSENKSISQKLIIQK